MSYADPIATITYSQLVGVTDTTFAIIPPYGATKVRMVDMNAAVTTTYNAVTTAAKIGVGVAGNTSKMGEISLGTTAAGSAVGLGTSWLRGTNPVHATMDLSGTSNTITGTPDIPEVLGPILITFTGNTGGTPAGAAVAHVTLSWF